MKFVVKFVVVLLLLVGLAQAALWFSTSRSLSRMADQLRPFATVEYGGTIAWLTGTVGARNVRIRPVAAPDQEIAVERVELDLGGPVALASFMFGNDGGMPDNARVRAHRLRLSSGLETTLREQASRLGYLAPFEALGCNTQGRFSGADYAELGWLDTGTDIEMTFARDQWQERQVSVSYDMRPLGRFDLTLAFDEGQSLARAMTSDFRIKSGNLRFHDQGMMAARNAYCARSNALAEEAFVDRHMDAVRGELEAFGMFLDPEVLAAYRQFATRGGSLALSITPSATIPMTEYRHYAPEDRLRMLNAQLRHDNGEPVAVTADFYNDAVVDDVPQADSAVRVVAKANEASAAELTNLPDLVGRRVILETAQATYVGTLLSAGDGLIWIENAQATGQERTLLKRDDVTSVRLLN